MDFSDLINLDRTTTYPLAHQHVRQAPWLIASGFHGMNNLIEKDGSTLAVVSASDMLTFGAIRALREKFVNVPQEMAVVGYNDFLAAEFITPSVTTVKAPAYELGREFMRMPQSLIKGIRPRNLKLTTDLIVRESCGCENSRTKKEANF